MLLLLVSTVVESIELVLALWLDLEHGGRKIDQVRAGFEPATYVIS